jgi:hypothetical protein
LNDVNEGNREGDVESAGREVEEESQTQLSHETAPLGY